MTETNVQDIQVHEPGSKHSSLQDGPGGFDRTWFMGTWGVAWSTLPMWEKTRGEYTVLSKFNFVADSMRTMRYLS